MRGGTPLAARAKKRVEQMKSAVTRTTPKYRHEDDETFARRIKDKFSDALHKMHQREHVFTHGTSKHKPHQGAKECARRVLQLQRGQICNYVHGAQYPEEISTW